MNSESEPSRPKKVELLECRRLLAAHGAALAFQLPQNISLGPTAEIASAHLGDINADGVMDIVVTGQEFSPTRETPQDRVSFLSVLVGDGKSFAERTDAPIPLTDIVLADYDLDGSPEINGRNSNGEWVAMDWLTSEKEPDQSPLIVIDSIRSLEDLFALGDFNLDGIVDVLTRDGTEISLQLGTLEEDAESLPTKFVIGASATEETIAVFDVDADGDLDIAAPCDNCGDTLQLSFWINNGLGEFSVSETHVPLIDVQLNSLRAADLDSDGQTDLILALTETGDEPIGERVDTFIQSDDGAFERKHTQPFTQTIESIETADLDADSNSEIIVNVKSNDSGRGSTNIITGIITANPRSVSQVIGGMNQFVGVSAGTLVSVSASTPGQLMTLSLDQSETGDLVELFETSIYPNQAHLLDVNGDGQMDVVGLSDGGISILVGQDRGGFDTRFLPIEDLDSYALQVGDFDVAPGSELVLVGNLVEGSHTALRRIELVDGQLVQQDLLVTERGVVIATEDLDNDGLLDFVFRSDFVSANRSSSVLLNREGGWLQRTLSTESGTVAIEDLDNDGTLEAYVFENPIRVFKYNEDDFIPWGEIPKGTTRAEVLDLNADGLKDFVSIQRRGGINNILTPVVSNGDGTWHQWDTVTVTDYEFVDANTDGLIDIASPRQFSLSVGDGTWIASDQIASESPVWAERNRYIDVNNDGIIDNAKFHINTGILDLHIANGPAWTMVEGINSISDFALEDLDSDGQSDLLQLIDGVLSVNYRVDNGWSETIVIAEDVRDYFIVNSNDDAWMDVEVVRAESYSIILQATYGEFVEGEQIYTGPITIEDVNADGRPDLKLVETETILATLQAVVRFGSESGFKDVDTIPLAQPETQWLGTTLWLNSTAEQSAGPRLIATSLDASSIDPTLPRAIADIDNDGDMDIFAMSRDGLLVIYGQGDGDFNGDGKIETVDVDMLRAAIGRQDTDVRFDINGDDLLDEEDVAVWIEQIARTSPGDADLNGNVEFSDFLKFSLNFGKVTTNWSDGDFDGDGVVSFTDFLSLSRFFGSSRLK